MTKKEYKERRDELDQIIRAINLETKQLIGPIDDQKQELYNQYLVQLLTENPHIKIGAQFRYGNDKVWIHEILLDHYSYELKVKLNKVKKDGTNGNASANSYGTSITNLKEIV